MNINHSIISGNLTRPVEMRTVGADKVVSKFTIAHNEKFKVNGEQREEVSFIDCEVWGKQAEVAAQYLARGSLTVVEGRIKQDNWQDKEGQKRSKLKMVVDRIHLTPRGEKRDASDPAPETAPAPKRPAAPSGGPVPEDAPFAICQFQGA